MPRASLVDGARRGEERARMLTIIGCGNPNRSDDGAGVVVAQRLSKRLAQHPVRDVRAFDCGTAGVEVMFAARGSDALIVIDASSTGAPPGTVARVPGDELARPPAHSYSTHDFRWDNALYAGRQIFGEAFPRDVTVWLIEVASVAYGLTLGPEVAAAADRVYELVLEQIARYGPASTATGVARVTRGTVHLPVELVEAHLKDCAAVVPSVADGRLFLLPVDERAGGLLLKVRNRRGDRAVDVGEVLRAHGLPTEGDVACAAAWATDRGGLELSLEGLR